MFLRRKRASDPRAAAWEHVAAEAGLELCTGGPELLADMLDLDSTPLAGPVYRARDTGALQVYSFDLLSDFRATGQLELTAACLLASDSEFCPVPVRFSRRLRSQLAGIQAGATQGQVVSSHAADGFDDRVTVVARDVGAAQTMLIPAVRHAVDRLLERSEVALTVTASRNQIMAQIKADQFELAGLPYLMTDLMAIYLAMGASGS